MDAAERHREFVARRRPRWLSPNLLFRSDLFIHWMIGYFASAPSASSAD
jgi:hypothetical protein